MASGERDGLVAGMATGSPETGLPGVQSSGTSDDTAPPADATAGPPGRSDAGRAASPVGGWLAPSGRVGAFDVATAQPRPSVAGRMPLSLGHGILSRRVAPTPSPRRTPDDALALAEGRPCGLGEVARSVALASPGDPDPGPTPEAIAPRPGTRRSRLLSDGRTFRQLARRPDGAWTVQDFPADAPRPGSGLATSGVSPWPIVPDDDAPGVRASGPLTLSQAQAMATLRGLILEVGTSDPRRGAEMHAALDALVYEPPAPTPPPLSGGAPDDAPDGAPPADPARRLMFAYLSEADADALSRPGDEFRARLGLPLDAVVVSARRDHYRHCMKVALRSSSFAPVPMGDLIPPLSAGVASSYGRPADDVPDHVRTGFPGPPWRAPSRPVPHGSEWTTLAEVAVNRPAPCGPTRYRLLRSGDGRWHGIAVSDAMTDVLRWDAHWEGTESGWQARRAYDWMSGLDPEAPR